MRDGARQLTINFSLGNTRCLRECTACVHSYQSFECQFGQSLSKWHPYFKNNNNKNKFGYLTIALSSWHCWHEPFSHNPFSPCPPSSSSSSSSSSSPSSSSPLSFEQNLYCLRSWCGLPSAGCPGCCARRWRKWFSMLEVEWPHSSQTYSLARRSLKVKGSVWPWIFRQWDSREQRWVKALPHDSHLYGRTPVTRGKLIVEYITVTAHSKWAGLTPEVPLLTSLTPYR